jgi:hypothetical protein
VTLELYPSKRRRKLTLTETVSNEQVQLDWIAGIQDQVNFANNPDVLPDYILYLKVGKTRLQP